MKILKLWKFGQMLGPPILAIAGLFLVATVIGISLSTRRPSPALAPAKRADDRSSTIPTASNDPPLLQEDSTFRVDLSSSHMVSQVPISDARHWDQEGYLTIRNNPWVSIRFPGGRSYEGDLFSITFVQDQDEVYEVWLVFNKSTKDETYKMAVKFAKDWDLPVDDIESWHQKAIAGKWDESSVMVMNNSSTPNVEVRIDDSFEVGGTGPARLLMNIGWPLPEKKRSRSGAE